jgi:hypothetical protein
VECKLYYPDNMAYYEEYVLGGLVRKYQLRGSREDLETEVSKVGKKYA